MKPYKVPHDNEDLYDSYLYSQRPAETSKPAWPVLDCVSLVLILLLIRQLLCLKS